MSIGWLKQGCKNITRDETESGSMNMSIYE